VFIFKRQSSDFICIEDKVDEEDEEFNISIDIIFRLDVY
jgi:hypothetical protein